MLVAKRLIDNGVKYPREKVVVFRVHVYETSLTQLAPTISRREVLGELTHCRNYSRTHSAQFYWLSLDLVQANSELNRRLKWSSTTSSHMGRP